MRRQRLRPEPARQRPSRAVFAVHQPHAGGATRPRGSCAGSSSSEPISRPARTRFRRHTRTSWSRTQVLVGVQPVPGVRASARRQHADLVVVVERADGDARELGNLSYGSHVRHRRASRRVRVKRCLAALNESRLNSGTGDSLSAAIRREQLRLGLGDQLARARPARRRVRLLARPRPRPISTISCCRSAGSRAAPCGRAPAARSHRSRAASAPAASARQPGILSRGARDRVDGGIGLLGNECKRSARRR